MSKQNFPKKTKMIFVDTEIDFKELQKISKIDPSIILITFDYNSHKLLQKMNISHELSENFLNDNDFENIQHQAYYFSNWAKQCASKNLLNYKYVNVGNLFYIEFFVFILPIIKKLFEIKKIHQIYADNNYYASGLLFDITKIFLNDVILFSKKEKIERKFIYDTVDIGPDFLKIKLPKNYYNKIKKISENFFETFFNVNKNFNKNGIMLIEFNTIRYESLFQSIHNNNLKSIYFGIRRPAIWNYKSYSIIKNSHTKIISNLIHDTELQQTINKGVLKMNENYEILLKQDILKNYFQFENKSFWNVIEPYFDKLWKNRIKSSIYDIENSYKILKTTQPKSILLLSESGYTEQIILSLAKEIGIHTFLLHHGMFHDTDKGHEWNKFSGSISINSDKFFVWGNSMKKYARHYKIPDSKIISVGTPVHDSLFNSKFDDIKTDKDTVLLIAQGPGIHLHSKDYSIKAYDDYYNSIKIICKSVLKLKKNLIIKLHPYENISNEKQIAHEISPKIIVTDKGDPLSLIKSCNAFVIIGTSLSTAILEAHIFRKPVIRVNYGEWMDKPDKLRVSSCHSIDPQDFFEVLKRTIYEKEYRNKLISIGEKFLEDYLVNPGDSSNKIASYLDHIDKKKSNS
jgi:hypothetical protein